MEFESLTGPEKAAVVILTLPEDTAKHFLNELDDDEVEQIMSAISRLDEVPTKLQQQVLDEFHSTMGNADQTLAGGRAKALELIESLGIELKTLPVRRDGQPTESTHVCAVPLIDTAGLTWRQSCVYRKLDRVLWIPVEADPGVALSNRRIGSGRIRESSSVTAKALPFRRTARGGATPSFPI